MFKPKISRADESFFLRVKEMLSFVFLPEHLHLFSLKPLEKKPMLYSFADYRTQATEEANAREERHTLLQTKFSQIA